MKLFMNEFGLYRSEDGFWGIRQINLNSWAIQHRDDNTDPWDWKVVGHMSSKDHAIMRMNEMTEEYNRLLKEVTP